MELGWAAVVQAILIAASAWYVRRGSHQDADRLKDFAAPKGQTHEILHRIKSLEIDVLWIKNQVWEMKGGERSIDHRGPKDPKGGAKDG